MKNNPNNITVHLAKVAIICIISCLTQLNLVKVDMLA